MRVVFKWKLIVILLLGFVSGVLVLFLLRCLRSSDFDFWFKNAVRGKSWNAEVEKYSGLYPMPTRNVMVFLGDSHMEQCEWQELFDSSVVLNRGIGGETTQGLLARMNAIPKSDSNGVIFLQIGINDLIYGQSPDDVIPRYSEIIDQLQRKNYKVVPTLVFYVQEPSEINVNVKDLNSKLLTLFDRKSIESLDINETIAPEGKLGSAFTADGIHLNRLGYSVWIKKIRSFLPRD